MSKANVLSIYFFILLFILGHQNTNAQFVEFGPIHKVKHTSSSTNNKNQRISSEVSIPFWEDFSLGIDTLKWTLEGVSYSETIGINAPSVGVLLFNGVGENGRPYSFNNVDQGITDKITSKTFDLTLLPTEQRESLYLSFFWQAGGRAEFPDENDQLILELLSENLEWIPIWSERGNDSHPRNEFTQGIIKVLPEFQHENFQFRFVARGRQSGPFDSWLVDYIYLNSGRNEENLDYPDRSLTQQNSLRLGEYGAYPLDLFAKNQEGLWSSIGNEFFNLEDRFRAMEYSIEITDSELSTTTPINSNTPFNPVPNALERREFESLPFESIPVPQVQTILKLNTSLTSGDDFLFEVDNGDTTRYLNVDYKVNDTVRSEFPLLDFFAYDNGSADYSAGINQRAGQLAVQFNTPEEVYIKGISINFTNPNQANQALDIKIWEDLEQDPIFERNDLIPPFETGNDFVYYSLDTNLVVNGDFYIGYTQFSDDFVYIGLDKINDNGSKIFYNVAGQWSQNEEVAGSLLIRPHISIATPFTENVFPEEILTIYPNPVKDELTVKGSFNELRIFDSFGREKFLQRQRIDEGEIINFKDQQPGVYIIQVITEEGLKTKRILVN